MYRKAGAFVFFDLGLRPFRTSWFIVGNCPLLPFLPVFVTRQTHFLVFLGRNIFDHYSTTEAIEASPMASELIIFIQFATVVYSIYKPSYASRKVQLSIVSDVPWKSNLIANIHLRSFLISLFTNPLFLTGHKISNLFAKLLLVFETVRCLTVTPGKIH